MKLNNHKLLLYTDDDHRENVLKSDIGIKSAQDILEDCE